MTLSAGTRLGSYEILSPLGAGGMGEVYLGIDPALDRRIALKVLHDTGTSRSLERFAREARSASSLNHPNIITIYEFAVDAEPPYIAMELVEGKSLRDLMTEEGPLTSRRALQIAVQIADGIAAAHDRGIVHRDLKPENVMISGEGYVKLLDFGLAKRPLDEVHGDVTIRREHNPTIPGTILGTVAYMSPEQARGGDVDYRSDQFSFGILLYEMMTGSRPFTRSSWPETLAAIISAEAEPIGHVNEKIPAPIRWAMERCLEKRREDRYASTRDLERELRNLRDHLSEATISADISTPEAPRAPNRINWLIGATAVLVMVIAGLLGWKGRIADIPANGSQAVASRDGRDGSRNLAILPFRDLTGLDGDEMLAAGLSATVSSQLSRLEGLQVMPAPGLSDISRSTTEIARDLGANLVLSGTLQRAGDQIRITYSIIDSADGRQIAGDTLTAISNDLFALQDQLSAQVTRALDLTYDSTIERPSGLEDSTARNRYLQAVGYLQRYENESSVDGAIRILDSLSNDSALVMAALGKAYLHKFKLTRDPKWAELAVRSCERAVAIDPGSADVRVTLGQVRLLQGRFEEAQAQFQHARATRPADVDAILGLAESLHRQKNISEAEQTYLRAVELQPDFWGVHNQLGAFYMSIGRFSDAAEQFLVVQRLTPDNARGLSNLGGAYMQMERWDEAIESFRRSLQISPSSTGYANLGTVHYFLGQFDEAADAYRKATGLTPDRFTFWAFLGDALRWSEGSSAEADQAYDRAIELAGRELAINPHNAAVRSQLAVCLAKRGDLTKAAAQSARALELEPDDLSIQMNAALVDNLRGDETLAAGRLRGLIASGWDRKQIISDPEFSNLVNRHLLDP